MSDLISRSELLEEIKSLSIVLNGKQIFSDDAKDTVLRIISEQPTAYDIDKVVERLNRETISSSIKESLGLLRAIEIVKQGGMDDVCEWESDYKISDKYKIETGCGYTFYEFRHTVPFKYCPYCGKKIKVVE